MTTTTTLLLGLLLQTPAPPLPAAAPDAVPAALATPAPATPAARTVPFGPGIKLFVAEMDGDLDGFLRAEIMKKKVPVSLVTDQTLADYTITGAASERKGAWHEGVLTGTKDKATGAVSVISRSGEIVWAEEAGDRSMMWGNLARGGPRKVASRLADRLKDYMQKQAKSR